MWNPKFRHPRRELCQVKYRQLGQFLVLKAGQLQVRCSSPVPQILGAGPVPSLCSLVCLSEFLPFHPASLLSTLRVSVCSVSAFWVALPRLRSQKISCKEPRRPAPKTQYLDEASATTRIILKVLLDVSKAPEAPSFLQPAQARWGCLLKVTLDRVKR